VFGREWYSTTVGERGRRAPCGGQVHCQLTTARGLLDLHRLTGEQPYLEAVLALHRFITREALWVSGGVGFYFNRPEENEACADADWVRLNLALWHATGDAHYLDLAEHALVNQLYFAQIDSGAFCYLRGLQNRGGATFDVCCSHHGPRALWEVMRYLFSTDARGVWVNLLLDGDARLPFEGGALHVVTTVSYEPDEVGLALTISENQPRSFALHVRVPAWAGRASVAVNGEIVDALHQAGYVSLDRIWHAGDRIDVRFPRVVDIRRGNCLGRHVLNHHEVAVLYGPHIYCVSDRWNPAVNLHLVRVGWWGGRGDADFIRLASNRLEASGVNEHGQSVRLILSPLAEVGGVANGVGRSHPVSTSPFRVWLPLLSREAA
jgi:uncharacterized protein